MTSPPASVQVTLPRYNYTATLPLLRIAATYPDSPIVQMLGNPNIQTIGFVNETITPRALDLAIEALSGRIPSEYDPHLKDVYDSLGIPFTEAYGVPAFYELVKYRNPNLPELRPFIEEIIDRDLGMTYDLLLKMRYQPTHADLIRAIEHNAVGIVQQLLLEIRVDPTANDLEALRTAIDNRSPEILTLLLNDRRIREEITPEEMESLNQAIGVWSQGNE